MKDFIVETSARHVHVTQETLEILFGKGFQLEVKKMLSQPGEFASNQKVDLIGPVNPKTGKNTMLKGVSILGPVRKFNQVEVAATDARGLKVPVVIKESGHLEGSAPITIVGPAGKVDLKEGLIVAKRHVHMTPEDATEMGVKNGDIVKVEVKTNERSLIFGDTVIRVSLKYKLAMHIDTDESNAANCSGTVMGHIVK
ncbi:MAG: phosphate propanoyltransferase [Mycoplasmoidaceae bacterium]|nr:phosphate propanoyltransferase [Mycoplasmoidaceae bacterium]